jgi:hypothetical protein
LQKELITSLTLAAKHARGGKVKGMRLTAVELPKATGTRGHLSPAGRGKFHKWLILI